MQQIITYTILATAVLYVGYRFWSSIRKKEACEKCELMKAAKSAPSAKR